MATKGENGLTAHHFVDLLDIVYTLQCWEHQFLLLWQESQLTLKFSIVGASIVHNFLNLFICNLIKVLTVLGHSTKSALLSLY
jgi:hypothetical protein